MHGLIRHLELNNPKNKIIFLKLSIWRVITILRQKIIFFPILGGRAPGAPPPLDPPLVMIYNILILFYIHTNRIGGIIFRELLSAVYRMIEPRTNQTQNYKNGICCFSAKHAASKSKSKD